MRIRIKIYQALVNRVPAIKKEYHRLRRENPTKTGRIYAWLILIKMNVCFLWSGQKMKYNMYHPDERKKIKSGITESEHAFAMTPRQLAEKLLESDIISFDIFDTLIFRPIDVPTDLFYFVGEKLHFMDFAKIRRETEQYIRQRKYRKWGTYEITLEEIYEELEFKTGISRAVGMQTEMETEMEFCFANPYMLEVFDILQTAREKEDKQIICISDMYLSSAWLKQILQKCGYTGIDEIFVSCEEGASKSKGTLYEKIITQYTNNTSSGNARNKRFVHIGDNRESDIECAEKHGFEAIYYPNVNLSGISCRAEDMSVIIGSLYRGIVNARIYSGLKQYTFDYELGYIYGGFFVMGYCQFIHQYAENHKVDKLLFLSRDGYIIKKVYDQMYSGEREKENGETEYVYWSRAVAVKLMAKYDRYDFLRRFVDHKVNQKYTIAGIFESMGLIDMMGDMINEITHNRTQDIIKLDTYLTDKNAYVVRHYLLTHWAEVISHYKNTMNAAKQFFSSVLENCKKVAVIDVGWAGSGALALDTLVNKEWELECDLVGLLAGTNSFHNVEPYASEQFLYSGKLVSYLYSQEHNRENWKWHNPTKRHNLLIELLLSSKEGSLLDILSIENTVIESLSDKSPKSVNNNFCFIQKKPDVNGERVEQIHRGILDFVEEYCRYIPKYYRERHCISGSDAYAVLKILLQSDLQVELDEGI